MDPYYHPLMGDFIVDSFSPEIYTENPSFINQSFHTRKHGEEHANINQPSRCNKVNVISNKFPQTDQKPKTQSVSGPPNNFTINFGDIKAKDEILSFSNSYDLTGSGTKNVPSMIGNLDQVSGHVLSERKRREKLVQRFNSLSSLLPDLKKMDKGTVLEHAAKYIQELESQVKELEELSSLKEKNVKEPFISAKRSRFSCSHDDGSSSNATNFDDSSSQFNPEMEVKIAGCSMLIEIYSRKNCTSLIKVLSEMQRLGLSVISSSTMPFADTNLLITIVAQKSDYFIMTPTDLVKNLKLAI